MKTALMVLLMGACAFVPAEPSTTARIARVIDGDSLEVDSAGVRIELRLTGVNAPEFDECKGPEATARMRALVASEPIAVRIEGHDQYGRSLGDLFVSGVSVAETMVAEGLAVVISRDGDADLFALQDRASKMGLGMWSVSACGATGPRPAVQIAAMTANPPGPDEEDLAAETVTITNGGESDIDLTGWILRDESTANRFEFPEGTILRPGTRMTISSGCGDTRALIYWCAAGPIWNNGGDTAFLMDSAGRIVSSYRHQP